MATLMEVISSKFFFKEEMVSFHFFFCGFEVLFSTTPACSHPFYNRRGIPFFCNFYKYGAGLNP